MKIQAPSLPSLPNLYSHLADFSTLRNIFYFMTVEEDDFKITHELVPCDDFCQTARLLWEPTECGVTEGSWGKHLGHEGGLFL